MPPTLTKSPHYLDDLKVGLRFVSGTTEVDPQAIMEFAKRFDPQPFHTDEKAAAGTMFGGLVASGWHTAAMSMRLLLEACPMAGGTIGLGGEVAWPQATRPGDVIRVECEIVDIHPSSTKPDRGIVTLRGETKNQRDETLQVLTAKLLVFRRPQA